MKHLRYISFALAGIILVSCDFLNEETRTDIEKDNFIDNASEAELVLLGVYRSLIEDGTYSMNLSFYLDMGTDISQVEGSTTENWRLVPTNAYPTTDSYIQNSWKALYEGVYRANDFLERVSVKMDGFTDDDKILTTLYIAEARCLRAMYYFELVRRWNRVPLMTGTALSYRDPASFTQAEPEDVYRYIEKDLLYAIDILPYAMDDTYRSSNSYRFSKGAALGLLTKVYCTWAGWPVQDDTKWEAAARTAQQLINSGKHDLLSNYETLWHNTCNGIWDPAESLIEVSFYSPTYSGNSDPCGRIGKWNGVKTSQISGERGSCAGNEKVVHTFVLDWRSEDEDRTDGLEDLRRDLSIANYRYGGVNWTDDRVLWVQGEKETLETALEQDADENLEQRAKQNYTPAKWDVEKYVQQGNYIVNDDRSNVNWYFLRYSDVLLLYAEALNEWHQGPTTDAYSAINKVRRRAYATSGTSVDLSGLDYEGFQEAVRKERAYELCFEGHRRADLVRWDMYYETIQATYNDLYNWWDWDSNVNKETGEQYYPNYVVYEYTEKGKSELLPIPQREIDLCDQFDQNPGWSND